jgi:D-proline reductase (dithiol) PrdB
MTTFPFYSAERRSRFESYAAEYRFDHSEPMPWMPLRRELRVAKLAMITTSGIRTKSTPPFSIDRIRGTAEYRELTIHQLKNDYTFDDSGFETREAYRDLNVLVPVDPVIDLAETKVIGELDETLYSFVGHCEDVSMLRASAAAVADKLHDSGVDVAFIFTASHRCNQTAGIIARELEKHALSTMCLITIKEVAQEVKIPRSVFINFPFGMPLGRAFARSLQESILSDMIQAMRTLDKPGRIVELPYKWDGEAA